MIGCRYCLIPGLQVQAVRFASLSLGCFATPCYALLWVAAFGQIGKVSCMCQGALSSFAYRLSPVFAKIMKIDAR